jgi:hypothetical protein
MPMKPEVRARIRAEMTPLIEAWRTSGETRRVFATRHGISLPKFDYWTRQCAPERAKSHRRAARFAAVAVVPPTVDAGVIELVLARGDRLVVRSGADVALVRAVLSAFVRC